MDKFFKIDKATEEYELEAAESLNENPYINHNASQLKAELREKGNLWNITLFFSSYLFCDSFMIFIFSSLHFICYLLIIVILMYCVFISIYLLVINIHTFGYFFIFHLFNF